MEAPGQCISLKSEPTMVKIIPIRNKTSGILY